MHHLAEQELKFTKMLGEAPPLCWVLRVSGYLGGGGSMVAPAFPSPSMHCGRQTDRKVKLLFTSLRQGLIMQFELAWNPWSLR